MNLTIVHRIFDGIRHTGAMIGSTLGNIGSISGHGASLIGRLCTAGVTERFCAASAIRFIGVIGMSLTVAGVATAAAARVTAADAAVASIHSVHLPRKWIQSAPVGQSRMFEGHAITFPARASRSQTSAEQSEFNAKDLMTWADALPRPATVSAPEV